MVYYANYLKYLERARTEWLRNLGIEQDVLAKSAGVIFAVRALTIEYLRPARFDAVLSLLFPAMARGIAHGKGRAD